MERRSLGLKFLLVCALAVLMSIPAFGVLMLIGDRNARLQAVVQEVGGRRGGEQTAIGPILAAPYRLVQTVPDNNGRPMQQVSGGWYAVFAEQGRATAAVRTEVPNRGSLFPVRVYDSTIDFNATFNLEGEPSALPEGATIDWSRAVLLVGVTDPRGVSEAAALQVRDGAAISFTPGSAYANVFPNLGSMTGAPGDSGMTPSGPMRLMQWLVADASELARRGGRFEVSTRVRLGGAEALSLTAFARNTDLRIHGDWPDVGYHGAFAATQANSNEAFDARWSIPSVRQNLADSGITTDLGRLSELAVTARFVDPANPYRAVSRSLKYALLFIGVVFLAYFLLEAMSETRVHPAQYVLVGLAQIVFYLLLLAIAERIGFSPAFLVAAGATVSLIGWYVFAVFRNRARAFAATAAFALLYALIYVLMTLEDFALLVGAVAAFIAIAAVMFFTRNVDWYGLGLPGNRPQPGADPPASP